jgi:predicted nucleic acid-binding protein
MTFDDLVAGDTIFEDANTLLYDFTNHPIFGAACKQLHKRVENKELQAYTTTHVLSEMVHRLMTIEAGALFGWSAQGIAARLRRHPAEVQQLSQYRRALDEIPLIGIQVLPIIPPLISKAADVIRQTGLLQGDALIVAVMREHNLTRLASEDGDFDRVPGLTRYAPR